MRNTISSLLLLLCSLTLVGQNKKFDSAAVAIIDRMSYVIGDMRSCKFKLTTTTDTDDPEMGMVKRFTVYNVFLSGSNKMIINAQGYRGHRQFKYNGSQLTWYSYDENNYGVIHTPPTTIKTIDSLSTHYGIDFPAADFFYPALTDDLMESSDVIRLVGTEKLDGSEYFHIIASSKDVDIQFWITKDEWYLPSKFVIRYKSQPGIPQYYASFSDWSVNPDLPGALFEFIPPPGATRVKIVSKTER